LINQFVRDSLADYLLFFGHDWTNLTLAVNLTFYLQHKGATTINTQVTTAATVPSTPAMVLLLPSSETANDNFISLHCFEQSKQLSAIT